MKEFGVNSKETTYIIKVESQIYFTIYLNSHYNKLQIELRQ